MIGRYRAPSRAVAPPPRDSNGVVLHVADWLTSCCVTNTLNFMCFEFEGICFILFVRQMRGVCTVLRSLPLEADRNIFVFLC